jgi:hypothetical protein
MLNEGNKIHNFILCLSELLRIHFITVPVPLRSVIELRFRFRHGKKVTVSIPVPQHSLGVKYYRLFLAGVRKAQTEGKKDTGKNVRTIHVIIHMYTRWRI